MAAVEEASGKLPRKRVREELQSERFIYEALSVGERASSDAECGRSSLSQVCRVSGLSLASDAVKLLRLGRDEELPVTSTILDSQCGYFSVSPVEEWSVPSDEGGDSGTRSCLPSYEPCVDLSGSVDETPDELCFPTTPPLGENNCEGISLQMEAALAENNTQVNISSLLEDCDEDFGVLFSNFCDSYEDISYELPSMLVACSDTNLCGETWSLSEEEDYFLSDLGFDTKAYVNEASNQERTMAVTGVDRVTDVSEIETSLFHFLEGSAGIIET
eukprot:c25475_g1_i1 orf=372-1193(-)